MLASQKKRRRLPSDHIARLRHLLNRWACRTKKKPSRLSAYDYLIRSRTHFHHQLSNATPLKVRMLRDGYMQMLLDLGPTEFLTFNFGETISAIDAQQRISKFMNMLQRKSLGPRWYKCAPSFRPKCIGFLEHKDSNLHYHVLVKSTKAIGRTFRRHGNDIWRSCSPRGQLDAQHIESAADVISYCTKAQIDFESFESPFIYIPKTLKRKN